MTAMSNPCRLLMGRLVEVGGGRWRLVEVEEVLDREVGEAPQLHVRTGAVARWNQSSVLDGVAPQLGMSQARPVHCGQDTIGGSLECGVAGLCGVRSAECGIDRRPSTPHSELRIPH